MPLRSRPGLSANSVENELPKISEAILRDNWCAVCMKPSIVVNLL